MMKKLLLLAAVGALSVQAEAKVKLPHVLGDNMVVQQKEDVRLWGWAKPGSTVTAKASWGYAQAETKADKKGQFLLTLTAPEASFTRHTITLSDGDGDPTRIHNVLSGEVWLCAGQSNMEMPMKGFGNCPVDGYNQEVVNAGDYSNIHFVKIPSVMSSKPLNDANCEWLEVSPATVGEASATGYFFAQVVSKALNVPVGLIMANKGGSRVESWLDREYLTKNTKEDLDSMHMTKKFQWDFLYPLLWGNGTVAPVLNYNVGGIIFYQGCSNVGDPDGQYTQRLVDLVKQWRRDFRKGELPFYFVQIAPYFQGDPQGDAGPKLRHQQLMAAKVIPHSGVVCTDDLVEPFESMQIHPRHKREVGQRLAYQALNKTYGMKSIWCESPEFKEMFIEGDTAYVRLQNEYNGISNMGDLKGFEVAGEDRVFHPATARHFWAGGNDKRNETILVTSPEVKKPVAVRYAWHNWGYGNVKNAALLPLFPFRTDNW